MGDDFYIYGVMISLLIWLHHVITHIANANSQFGRNLKRVGMRLSWTNGLPVPINPDEGFGWKTFRFIFVMASGLTGVLLSWLSVWWFIGFALYNHSKQQGAPEAVRNMRWKLKNLDLTKDQIEYEMASVNASVTPSP